MRYAVSGFCGMIGYALLRTLGKDDEIIAITRPNAKLPKEIKKDKRLKFFECDIRNYDNCATNETADVFIHLAWLSTGQDERNNERVQLENVKYTLDAIELAAKMGCRVFIGAGSQAEYGNKEEKLTANTVAEPKSAYGIAKYCAGKMGEICCNRHKMRINWVRFLSVYGEYDRERNFIPYLIKTFLDGDIPEVTECTQIWDYIYCDDVARAVFAVAEKGKNGKSYPIGSGKSDTLRNFVMKIKEATGGKDVHFGARERKNTEPYYLCADISELFADTGFLPETDFDDGIKRCVDFIKENR